MKKITIHNYPLDNIDTDRIIPGKYTKTLNPQDLIDHCLEDLDHTFKSRVSKGDFLAGGNNFGCGSSREQAPLALKLSGIDTIIAKSFARIFYRNAINIGLQLLEIPEFDISESTVNGNFDESLKYLNKAIEINQNCAEALINRGLVSLAQNDKENTLSDLEKAHHLKPHIKEIWHLV